MTEDSQQPGRAVGGTGPDHHSVREALRITWIDIVEITTDYLDEALEHGDRARFEQHLALCMGCAAFLEQIRTVIALAGRLDTIEHPDLAPYFAELLAAYRQHFQA